jgi:hypothetical protein
MSLQFPGTVPPVQSLLVLLARTNRRRRFAAGHAIIARL